MKSSMQDVLVIGSGPVGSYTAKQLAKKGLKVTVLEKRPQLGGPVCCAGIISLNCAKLLNVESLPVINWYKNASLFSPSGYKLDMSRNETQAVTVNRGLLDKLMAEEAAQHGVDYKYNCKVNEVNIDNEGVKVRLQNSANSLKGKMAIVAAGCNPTLSQNLALGRVSDFAVGVQAVVETSNHENLEVYFGNKIAPGFFAWYQPLDANTSLAGLLTRKRTLHYFKEFLKILSKRNTLRLASKPLFRCVSLNVLPRSYDERLLILGDSAGQVKPLTGGGLYYGLRAARIAVDTTSKAVNNNDFSAASLADYQNRWHKEMLGSIRLSRFARSLFERYNDTKIDRAFLSIERAGLVNTLSDDPGLGFDDHGKVVSKVLKMPSFYRVLLQLLVP